MVSLNCRKVRIKKKLMVASSFNFEPGIFWNKPGLIKALKLNRSAIRWQLAQIADNNINSGFFTSSTCMCVILPGCHSQLHKAPLTVQPRWATTVRTRPDTAGVSHLELHPHLWFPPPIFFMFSHPCRDGWHEEILHTFQLIFVFNVIQHLIPVACHFLPYCCPPSSFIIILPFCLQFSTFLSKFLLFFFTSTYYPFSVRFTISLPSKIFCSICCSVTTPIWSRIHERTIWLRFLAIIFSGLRFPYTTFTLQTSFKPLLLRAGGGGGRQTAVVEVTVNSKGENSEDFCPNYVQEFDLCVHSVKYFSVRKATMYSTILRRCLCSWEYTKCTVRKCAF